MALALSGPHEPRKRSGGLRAPRRFIDWQTFFDLGDGRARHNKKIDTTLSSSIFALMGIPSGGPDSLATRNLLRNLTMKVPSGQAGARVMRLPELRKQDLADLAPHHLDQRTPAPVSTSCARPT